MDNNVNTVSITVGQVLWLVGI